MDVRCKRVKPRSVAVKSRYILASAAARTNDYIAASKVSKAELVKVTAVEKFADCLLLRWMTAEQVVKEADGDMSGDIDLVEFSDLCLNTTAPSAYGGGSRGSLPRG